MKKNKNEYDLKIFKLSFRFGFKMNINDPNIK